MKEKGEGIKTLTRNFNVKTGRKKGRTGKRINPKKEKIGDQEIKR